jgi:tripartite-type tricarboxylate transporter receptor subunit TctC
MFKFAVPLLAGLLALTGAAEAQNYPSRPVTIIVGFGQGGPDTNARLLAAQLAAQTGGNFVVENKPGATGMIGAETVAHAAPDGYTLLMSPASIASLPAMHKGLSFDLQKDFVPISIVSRSEASFLVATNSLPAKNLQELIALAKSKSVAYSSTGIGTGSHLRMALFGQANGIKLNHIPFKSPGEALSSIINGETQIQFLTSSQALPYLKEGRIKALAFDSDKRAEFMPDVPTIVEAGAQPTNLDSGWNGLLAPKGTPPEVIAWLEKQVKIALQNPGLQAQLDNLGLTPTGSTGAEFAEALKDAVDSMGAAVQAAGIKQK